MSNSTNWSATVNGTTLRDEIDKLYSAIPSSVEVDTSPLLGAPEEHRATAFKLAEQLNILRDFLDKAQKIEPGTITDTVYTLAGIGLDEDWPEDANTDEAYKQSGPVILMLLENLKVVEETLDTLPINFDEDNGKIDLEEYFVFGRTPADDLLKIIGVLTRILFEERSTSN